MNLWRIQTKTSPDVEGMEDKDISPLMLENRVAAIGWSLNDRHLRDFRPGKLEEYRRLRGTIGSMQEYDDVRKEMVDEHGKAIYEGDSGLNYVKRLLNAEQNEWDVRPGDLFWMRSGGIYYLARVPADKQVVYNHDAVRDDAAIQIPGMDWQRVGDESAVPGAVATSFIRRKTLQQIHSKGARVFSALFWQRRTGETVRLDPGENLSNSADRIRALFDLLSPYECEDLLCLYLYHLYGYICVPSTSKKGTELYECVLLDPASGRSIYPQVKAGDSADSTIRVSDYLRLAEEGGEVWLFQTKGNIDRDAEPPECVHIADPEALYAFAVGAAHRNLLPGSIRCWVDFLASQG